MKQIKKFSPIAIFLFLIIAGCGGGSGGGANSSGSGGNSPSGGSSSNSAGNSPSGGTMNLAWDASTDHNVTGYRVYYGTASKTYGSPVDVGNVTTATLNQLTIGRTYFVAVTAYNSSGSESPFSNEVSGTAD